jgi:hypothetical protein
MPATIFELYDAMLESFSELANDVCAIEALYRSRAQFSDFATQSVLDTELDRLRHFFTQHAADTESSGRWLLERLRDEANAKKGPA